MTRKNYDKLRERFYKDMERRCKKALNLSFQKVLLMSRSTTSSLDEYVNDEPVLDFYRYLHQKVTYIFGKEIYSELTGLKKAINSLTEFDLFMQNFINNYVATEVAKMVVRVSMTTKNLIREVVGEALGLGYSIERTSQLLQTRWRSLLKGRATIIARSEVLTASNAGALAGAKATGYRITKEWLATRDKRTRIAHFRANHQRRDINEPFIVDGERLMFPGDSSLGASPSNTIICRCAQKFIVL